MNNLCAYLRSGVLQNGYEIGKAVVSDLPSPQSLHCLDIECFKSNKCMTLNKLPGDLPLPGTALIGDAYTAHHDRSETAQTAVFFCSKAFKVDKKCLLINGLADILTLQPTFFYSSRQGEKQTS